MTSRERVLKTLHHEKVDRLPRHLWALPGVTIDRADEYKRLLDQYEMDIVSAPYIYGPSTRTKGRMCIDLEYTDVFGVEWKAQEYSVTGEVKKAPIADWEDLYKYSLPWELLDNANIELAMNLKEKTDKFVVADTFIRPFERLQFLHTTVNTLMDLALEDENLIILLSKLHEFNLKELELWCKTDVDGIEFMDDWGSQKALLISPALWRKYFKPLYKQYVDMIHKAGKYAFMHSDGHITEIYDDLVEIGVDALNSQLFCMNIEELGEKYSGKITFWGEVDRQYLLPFGSADDVHRGVRRAAKALLSHSDSGAVAQCEWGKIDKYENIDAVFSEWLNSYSEIVK
jgi:hypothetical protein